MTQVPSGAQLSDDGQWWWDGTQWQPVPAGGETATQGGTGDPASGAASTAAAPASTAASDPGTGSGTTEATGQLSEDGQWRWDGTQWQPVQPAAGSTPASGSGADPNAAQQTGEQGADTPPQWDLSSASTAAVFTLNEQPDPSEQQA
jgi:hypothetical protein